MASQNIKPQTSWGSNTAISAPNRAGSCCEALGNSSADPGSDVYLPTVSLNTAA